MGRFNILKNLVICAGIALVSFAFADDNKIVYGDDKQYIEEISTAKDDEGKEKLESDGYYLLYPSIVCDNDAHIWIGYKTTEDESKAVTDIYVEGNSSNIKFETSKKGDSPIEAIHVLSSDTNSEKKFDKVYPIANNGAIPIKDKSGKVYEFKTDNDACYLSVVKKNIWKNYVSNIKVVSKKSKKAAIVALANNGCEYYVDKNMSDEDGVYTYIGYEKTSDSSKAITDVIALSGKNVESNIYTLASKTKVSGAYLYITTNEKYGNPIVDIDYLKDVEDMDVTAKQWTDLIIASGDNLNIKSYILESDEYINMSSSEDEYYVYNIDSDKNNNTGIILTSLKDSLDGKAIRRSELINNLTITEDESKEVEDNESDEDIKESSEEADDSGDVSKDNEITEVQDDDSEEEVTDIEDEYVIETVNTDENGEEILESETYINDETVDGIGTVKGKGTRIPKRIEVTIFVFIAILIPALTYYAKKKLEDGETKKKA